MAKVKFEELPDKIPNPEPEANTKETASKSDPKFTITTQETENMKVQKYPHQVMHKKKWGEYLLEFVMLFHVAMAAQPQLLKKNSR